MQRIHRIPTPHRLQPLVSRDPHGTPTPLHLFRYAQSDFSASREDLQIAAGQEAIHGTAERRARCVTLRIARRTGSDMD